MIAGLCTLLMRPARVLRSAIVLRPSTLLHFHHLLIKHQTKVPPAVFAQCQTSAWSKRTGKRIDELIDAVVEEPRETVGFYRLLQLAVMNINEVVSAYTGYKDFGGVKFPIFGPFGLVQQLGPVEYARPRKFREKLQQWLKAIRLVWPECPAEITADGENLKIHPAKSIPSSALAQEPPVISMPG